MRRGFWVLILIGLLLFNLIPTVPMNSLEGVNYPEQEMMDDPTDTPSGSSGEVFHSPFEGWFTENRGQMEEGAGQYYVLGYPVSMAYGIGWMAYRIEDKSDPSYGALVRVVFVGARDVTPVGLVPIEHRSHFFIGNDPDQWVPDVRSYRKVIYENLWDGVNLLFYFSNGKLKYDLVIERGIGPDIIQFRYEGAEDLLIDELTGDLVIRTPVGAIHDAAPIAFQNTPAGKVGVRCEFDICLGEVVRFNIENYDDSYPLVIDPGLVFSTHLGGTKLDTVDAVTVDHEGSILVAGDTNSFDFPTTPGVFRGNSSNYQDIFVTKMNALGTKIIWSTYIGGEESHYGPEEEPADIWVDDEGCPYITGYTGCDDFPTTAGALQTESLSPWNAFDAFALKLANDGSSLVFSTYISGNSTDGGNGIRTDDDGNIIVSGTTSSEIFLNISRDVSYPKTHNDLFNETDLDAFVLKLDANGTTLLQSIFIGGSTRDLLSDMSMDDDGHVYLCGSTYSPDFPTTHGAFDTEFSGEYDVYVLKLEPDLSDLIWSTFLGGTGFDWHPKMSLDSDGSIYISTNTYSTDFPTTSGVIHDEPLGYDDLTLSKLSPDGSTLLMSTYLGGDGPDKGFELMMDELGNIYLTGYTHSSDLPTTETALMQDRGLSQEAFLYVLDHNVTEVLYCSYIGGDSWDTALAMALIAPFDVVLAGWTASSNFPTTEGALFPDRISRDDGFVMRIKPEVPGFWFVEINDGERLFAGYKDYDFRVDANPERLSEMPINVSVHLDPGGADVVLRWDGMNATDPFSVVSDPGSYVILYSDAGDVETDEENGTSYLHFKLLINWSWPHENYCDILWEGEWEDLPSIGLHNPEVFYVENDLAFTGDLTAQSDLMGELDQRDWVPGGDDIMVQCPAVVYEGTEDVFPPSGVFDVVLTDDDGDHVNTNHIGGANYTLRLKVDNRTDLEENLTLTLWNLPNESVKVSNRTFPIRVDADPPIISRAIPDGDVWQSVHNVDISVTVDDSPTSGVHGDLVSYMFSTRGPDGYGDLMTSGLEFHREGPAIEARVVLEFPDGEDNYVKWIVYDAVGNMGTLEMRIRVDTRNVTFTDPVPDPYTWQRVQALTCGVTIVDVEGSGIDVSTIQYRISPRNLSQYGEWSDWNEGVLEDAPSVIVSTDVRFGEAPYNYIQWRAMDIAGNGYTASPHYRVRVDVTSILFDAFAPGEGDVQVTKSVLCTVHVIDNPGGSGVDLSRVEFRYRSSEGEYVEWDTVGMEGVISETVFTLIVNLTDGYDNAVQFRGYDAAGNGPSTSEEFIVYVDTTPPEFIEVLPGPEDKQPGVEVEVIVRVRDVLTGVDTSQFYFSSGTRGEGSFGDWNSIGLREDNDTFISHFMLFLETGQDNVIRFRAIDRAGNEVISHTSTIWVNSPPIAIISSPREGENLMDSEPIILRASGTDDIDGDALNFTWLLMGYDDALGYGESLEVHLAAGDYNLTLVVKDDIGAEDRITRTLIVEHDPPRTESRDNDWLLVLLIVIGAVILSLAYLIRKRSLVVMRKDE